MVRADVLDELLRVAAAQNPALRIRVPVLLPYGLDDATVTPGNVRLLIRELRGRGDRVEARGYPGADHTGVVSASADDVLAWITARLRGGLFTG